QAGHAVAHSVPREPARRAGEPAVRRKSNGFERHRDDVPDMRFAVEHEGPPFVRPTVVALIVWCVSRVCRVVGTSEFVVPGFGNPPETDPEPAPKADPLVGKTQ